MTKLICQINFILLGEPQFDLNLNRFKIFSELCARIQYVVIYIQSISEQILRF